MPNCKNCNREITKSDYDICPYCGQKNPIPTNYETMDVTACVKQMEPTELPRTKSLKTMTILGVFLGYLGIPWFYVKKPKAGWISLVMTILIVAGAGIPAFFLLSQTVWSFLVPFFAVWLFHIVFSIVYSRLDNIKDGDGELLR